MKHALCFVLALLCLDVSILSAAPQEGQQFPKELRDPTFLRQLTWRADKKLENLVAGWWPDEHPDEQSTNDLIVQRFTGIRILESESVAVYRTSKTKSDADIFIALSGDTVTDDCDALFTWTKGALGQPEKVVDLSMASRTTGTDLSADWLFGKTRVQFMCRGGRKGTSPPNVVSRTAALNYGHRERLAVIQDPIHLECSSQQRDIGGSDQTARDVPPVGFIIDPNSKRLLRGANNVPYEKQAQFTDKEIVVGSDDKEGTVQIRIDRVTASYLLTLRLKNAGGLGSFRRLEQWGKCVPVAPGKKF
jgi:hypothetical protein